MSTVLCTVNGGGQCCELKPLSLGLKIKCDQCNRQVVSKIRGFAHLEAEGNVFFNCYLRKTKPTFLFHFRSSWQRLTADMGLVQAGIFLPGYTLAEQYSKCSSYMYNHPTLIPGKVKRILKSVQTFWKQEGKNAFQ